MHMTQADYHRLTAKLEESIATEKELEIIKLATALAKTNEPDLAVHLQDMIASCSAKLAKKKTREQIIQDLQDLMLYCVKRAVDAHIKKHTYFEINVDSTNGTSQLDDDVVECCGVRFDAACIAKPNEYEIVGHVVGVHADCFSHTAAEHKFMVTVYHEFGLDKSGYFNSSEEFSWRSAEWLYSMEMQQLEDAVGRLEMLINFNLKATVTEALIAVRGL